MSDRPVVPTDTPDALRALVEKLEGNWRVRAASLRASSEPNAYRGNNWTTPRIMRERATMLEESADELRAALTAVSPLVQPDALRALPSNWRIEAGNRVYGTEEPSPEWERGYRAGRSDRARDDADELEAALTAVSRVPETGLNPERLADLSAQCIEISTMMSDAGLGPCTLREGVRELIRQRDEAAAVSGVQTPEPQKDVLKNLASAMRKVLPPKLFAEVVAHLDPLTPFLDELQEPLETWTCNGCKTEVLIRRGAEVFDCVTCGGGNFTKLPPPEEPRRPETPKEPR